MMRISGGERCGRVCKLILTMCAVTLAARTARAGVITAVYPSFDSSNITAFQVNGNASLANGVNGTPVLRLTPSMGGRSGSAFWKNKVNLANNRSFSAYFSMRFSYPGNGGADGIVFCIQTESNNAGSSGGGMGYEGISPSLGVEFDTYNDSGYPIYDPDGNHIGVDVNGSVASVVTAAAPGSLKPSSSWQAGPLWYVWIEYDGSTGLLEVRMSTTNSRPATATLSHTMSPTLAATVGADVYVGFTAATGGSYEDQDIESFYFNNDYISGGIDPGTSTQAPVYVVTTASPAAIAADGSTTSTIAAKAEDINLAGMSGQTLTFTTTAGTLSGSTAVTDVNGNATVTLTSAATAGTATVRATAQGGAYRETNVLFALIALSPTSLPAGTVFSTYSQTFTGSGGTAPYHTYTVASGALPPGLSLNSSTGVLSGTPTAAGSFPFTISVTDSSPAAGPYNGSRSYTLTVAPGPAVTLVLSGFPATTTAGATHSLTVTLLDAWQNTATGYLGTVHFTSTDAAAWLPPDAVFVAADAGVKTFSATLNTVGTHAITAGDTVTASLVGSESGIVVNVRSAAPIPLLGGAGLAVLVVLLAVAGALVLARSDAIG